MKYVNVYMSFSRFEPLYLARLVKTEGEKNHGNRVHTAGEFALSSFIILCACPDSHLDHGGSAHGVNCSQHDNPYVSQIFPFSKVSEGQEGKVWEAKERIMTCPNHVGLSVASGARGIT